MGYYEPLNEKTNNFSSWKLLSTVVERYLYRYVDGHWHISDILGDVKCWLHSVTKSKSPFTAGLKWKYVDESDNEWHDDESFQIVKQGESDRYNQI